MKIKTMCVAAITAIGLVFASLPATAGEKNHKVKLVAGSPGYDHIQPFIAEYLGLWKKYGVDVEFFGGNYIRANTHCMSCTSTDRRQWARSGQGSQLTSSKKVLAGLERSRLGLRR